MKAILVIDIPKGYEVDQLAVNYMLYSVDGKVLDGDMGKELKPMPQKKEVKGDYYKQREIATEMNDLIDFDKGYNKCIDEILEETDEWRF